ncbi:DNA damage-inducible transcript 3 protein [Melanerpes formicivorus]|uniref:DNA damage-inducible transcript 3 protein n=1 Tax=Melanerpes formicivorus TaxID=211600 RepID=UPI00358EC33B
MAAEELPLEAAGWELEAWCQELQELLAAPEPGGHCPAWEAEQAELALPRGTELAWGAELALPWGTELAPAGPQSCQLDAALAAELLQLLGPEGTTGGTQAPAGTACPAQPGTEEEPRGAAAAAAAAAAPGGGEEEEEQGGRAAAGAGQRAAAAGAEGSQPAAAGAGPEAQRGGGADQGGPHRAHRQPAPRLAPPRGGRRDCTQR